MSYFKSSQLLDLLKDGTKHLSGLEEAVIKNIEACKKLSSMTKTSLGPNGKKKMVINHIEKLFVTNDASTIIKELDVVHPAAKILVMASQMQEQEVGDGTNFVVVFGGELLQQAESLIRMGLHPSEIIAGYTKAGKFALEYLEKLTVKRCENLRDELLVSQCIRSCLSSKQYGYEDLLSPLIAKACIQILPKDPKDFNTDLIRVIKIPGGGVLDSELVKGFVVSKGIVGTIKRVEKAKIAIFVMGLDTPKPETKGTVLLNTASELENYSKTEEEYLEKAVKEIAESGANVVVSGGNIADMALHYLEKYKIMVIKIQSKFQLRRLCKATGATPLVRLGKPTPEECGSCDLISQEEIGSTIVTIFKQFSEDSEVSTIIIRGSTRNLLDDIERAIDDGVNNFKQMTKDDRFVPGAGATEIELAKAIYSFGESCPGLDQYAVRKFAEALEVIPRTLADNSGTNSSLELLSNLFASHQNGQTNAGVDIETGEVIDSLKSGILDGLRCKHWAIRLATDAAVTILKIDQLIMAKTSGGPNPQAAKKNLKQMQQIGRASCRERV